MSFSSQVKDEVAKLKVDEKGLILSELSGLTPMCSKLYYTHNGLRLEYVTENAPTARRVFTFLRRSFGFDVEVSNVKSKQLSKNLYIINIDDNESCRLLLDELKYIRGENVFTINYLPYELTQSSKEKKAYIRGAFLGAGSVTNPEKNYHLEFVAENEESANFLQEMINSFGLYSKVIERKDKFVVYLKEAEQISDLLSIIGAYRSMLEFENIRVIKDMRNNVNRIVNCETANLSKTVKSSYDQIEDIKIIDEKLGIENLDDDLRELAEIRLNDRYLSLKDIAEILTPQVSKSTVNYRFKKIKKIADNLRGDINEK
ncbi:DNA-binding protein WhiA [Peptoniphilus sp.]|jgi:DNA-binding protein WhiA|uniref:DNA-binding protein WhiA n=1 Tax=Peptoniphilus sp. TaxID=1971214 RepID=UPI003D8D03DC